MALGGEEVYGVLGVELRASGNGSKVCARAGHHQSEISVAG